MTFYFASYQNYSAPNVEKLQSRQPEVFQLATYEPFPVVLLLALRMELHLLPVATKSQTQKVSAPAWEVLPWWWD